MANALNKFVPPGENLGKGKHDIALFDAVIIMGERLIKT